jgi:hypothetical protein
MSGPRVPIVIDSEFVKAGNQYAFFLNVCSKDIQRQLEELHLPRGWVEVKTIPHGKKEFAYARHYHLESIDVRMSAEEAARMPFDALDFMLSFMQRWVGPAIVRYHLVPSEG